MIADDTKQLERTNANNKSFSRTRLATVNLLANKDEPISLVTVGCVCISLVIDRIDAMRMTTIQHTRGDDYSKSVGG